MDNKKVKKFLNQTSFFKGLIKPKYRKYYDEITSLYLNGTLTRIDQATKLFDKLTKRGKGPDSAIKQINKLTSTGTIKKEPSSKHHLVARFLMRTCYYKTTGKYMIDDLKEFTANSVDLYNKSINLIILQLFFLQYPQ
jgi:hypothetical protein